MIRVLTVCALLMAVSGRAAADLAEGQKITNFTFGKFILGGGATEWITKPGYDKYFWPNSFTAFVTVTDVPQLCIKVWKEADITKAEVGSRVCFTLSFSNCGGYTGYMIKMLDIVPENVMLDRADGLTYWQGGSFVYMLPLWGYTLEGATWNTDWRGQIGPLYIKWQVYQLGIQQSGWQRYCVTIL